MLLSIQYLRGIAALMVVIFHLLPQMERKGYTFYWPDWLFGGVDVFFVISGFIMWITTANRTATPMKFYKRRIIRIVPLYWILTSFIVVVMLVKPTLLQSTRYDFWHIISSYFFIPSLAPGSEEQIHPVLHPGWTLNYEMFFYLLFGLLLYLPERFRIVGMTIIMSVLVAYGSLASTLSISKNPIIVFYTHNIMIEFMIGMLVGHFYLKNNILSSAKWGWSLLIAGFFLLGLLPEALPTLPRVVILGLPATLIVIGALKLEATPQLPKWPWLLLLGNASYSIYLSHTMTLSAIGQIWRRAIEQPSFFSYMLFGIVGISASIMIGVFTYYIIERPVTQRLHSRT
ncbi:MAG: acyltransferase [Pigmentiphaga sp.]|nr:acyltransferase [Pigmentiphaga sp.]